MNAFIERGQRRRGSGPPAPASRQEAKEATHGRVLDAAKTRLEAVGFERTSIRDVAQAAGVATGTVLLHFPDKRDLLHAAFFDDLERTWAAARAATGQAPLRRDLSKIADAFFDYYARRRGLSRTLLKESLFAEPPWSGRFAAQVADVHRHVASLAAAAKVRGEIDRHTDAAVLAASFFSFYYFALLAWLQAGHPEPRRLFRRMLDQHLGLARGADRAGAAGPKKQTKSKTKKQTKSKTKKQTKTKTRTTSNEKEPSS